MLEAVVSAVGGFGVETHCCAVGAAGVGGGVVGARAVPGETEEDGRVGAVVIIIIFPNALGDGIVDVLVVCWCGVEDTGELGFADGFDVVFG